jgi:hypothetical protein
MPRSIRTSSSPSSRAALMAVPARRFFEVLATTTGGSCWRCRRRISVLKRWQREPGRSRCRATCLALAAVAWLYAYKLRHPYTSRKRSKRPFDRRTLDRWRGRRACFCGSKFCNVAAGHRRSTEPAEAGPRVPTPPCRSGNSPRVDQRLDRRRATSCGDAIVARPATRACT